MVIGIEIMDIPTEIWSNIPDYNYSVSSYGRIKNNKTMKILKPVLSHDGYLQITLYKKDSKKNYRISRLVCKSFILNPENKPHINHKDLNKTNNKVENLEWCTAKENVYHAIVNGHRSKGQFKKGQKIFIGEKHPLAKVNYKEVAQIKELYKTGNYTQRYLGELYSLTQSSISLIVLNKSWKSINEYRDNFVDSSPSGKVVQSIGRRNT